MAGTVELAIEKVSQEAGVRPLESGALPGSTAHPVKIAVTTTAANPARAAAVQPARWGIGSVRMMYADR